jgi:soluble lytic murein transglycosylase
MPIANSIHPEKWWFHRMQLARKYYGQNDFKKAYMLSKNHGLSRGVEFAKSEWFAGWLALRKLNAPKVALAHFQHLHENVSTPVSRSRAAYWAGRASFAIKDYANARKWYTEAAKYGTTFYGQLAHEALGHKKSTILPNDPLPTAADLKWIKSDPLLKIARFIAPSALRQDTRLFLTAAFDKADSPGKMALITRIARELGYADMSVRLSRSAKMKGIALVEAGYPIPKMINKQQPPETALLLALIRQESSFDPDAQSPVGARGLMQLMPATAQAEARKLKLSYTTAKLTDDPQYNMTLGKSYLNGLLQRFDGSYILAIASYTAGPTAVSRWVKEYGSPTDPNVDVVDWIESIPYSETRNYVQRILESTQVYRKRLGATAFKTTLMHDLLR